MSERGQSQNLWMIRRHLRDVPRFELPAGYALAPLRPVDGAVWAAVWNDADATTPDAHRVTAADFTRAFGEQPEAIPLRCMLVVDATGEPAATASAWWLDVPGRSLGRVHWLATRRAHQGRGLARALLSEVLLRLAAWHPAATLLTQRHRTAAIRLYERFGFEPASEQDLNGPPTPGGT